MNTKSKAAAKTVYDYVHGVIRAHRTLRKALVRSFDHYVTRLQTKKT